jgi:hypothetical protein
LGRQQPKLIDFESGSRTVFEGAARMAKYMQVEDLKVYQMLCRLHIEICDLSHRWPPEEKSELGGQIRRSSNSSPANLAEKHSDRHLRNKIEGVNRSRGEALETTHHLYIA